LIYLLLILKYFCDKKRNGNKMTLKETKKANEKTNKQKNKQTKTK